jgi:fused signal recognition particle receptor
MNKSHMFSKLLKQLRRKKDSFGNRISGLFGNKTLVREDLLQNLERVLLTSDVGIKASGRIIAAVKNSSHNESPIENIRYEMQRILEAAQQPLTIENHQKQPFIILVVGVNGAGKTTSIAKLAKNLKERGLMVVLAAGDTFRAAAVEQIQEWGLRLNLPVISKPSGSDPASLAYEAHQQAISLGADVLIIDTAGRLHTQDDLMAELKKIKRVIGKQDDSAPHEVILVLDGTSGQNTLKQTEIFVKEIGISSLIVTKLDGTAKGGALFNLANEFELPVRYIGIGEGLDDLLEFDAKDFVSSLLHNVGD